MSIRKHSLDGSVSSRSSTFSKVKACFRRMWSGPGQKDCQISIVNARQNPSGGVLKPNRRLIGGPNEPEYFTGHESRGKVYIFNQVNFKKVLRREGSKRDVINLYRSLPKLGFRVEDIECFDDLTLNEIEGKLEEISKSDHSKSDMMVVFVLTHGERDGKIHAYDREYTVNEIWEHFTADKCETLKGKPKIFFVIACRGDKMDDGACIIQSRKLSVTEIDAVRCQTTVAYTIPIWADFLTIYSTMEGHYSYRNPIEGTWYIQALCQEIANFSEPNMHFLDFLTRVNRKVAITYETIFDDPNMNRKKQCPFLTSSLTKVINLKLEQVTNDSVTTL